MNQERKLPSVASGWKARATGTYFEGQFPQLKDRTLVCSHPIRPPDNPNFQADRYSFWIPDALRDQFDHEGKPAGRLIVLHGDDVKEWSPPGYADLQFPNPYYPAQTLRSTLEANWPRSIEKCDWYRPVIFAAEVSSDSLHPSQRALLGGLRESFSRDGHRVEPIPSPISEYLVVPYPLPLDDSRPLRERIPEVQPTILEQISKKYGLGRLHPNLTVAIPVTEDLTRFSQQEWEETVWSAMGRLGAFSVLFITVDPETQTARQYTFGTLEGGRGTTSCLDELRDWFVTRARAGQVERPPHIPEAIAHNDWQNCQTAGYLTQAGKKFGELGILDPPVPVSRFVSPARARTIQRLVGWQRQAPGALVAFAHDLILPFADRDQKFTGGFIASATGREEVDKTDLHPERGDLTVVDMRNGELRAYGVTGIPYKAPSVEADEFVAGIRASGTVRMGDYTVPLARAVLHTHRGVRLVRPVSTGGRKTHVVTHLRPNLEKFPHAVGCGSGMMEQISREILERAGRDHHRQSPVIAWIMDVPRHGTNFVSLAAPHPETGVISPNPFANLLWLFENGVIELTEEVPQEISPSVLG